MHTKPKKRLGQNFLFDKNIQKKIIDACEFEASDIVLEIGSGRAELTKLILEKVKKIYALEIDFNLAENLRETFKGYKNVKIINADVLKFNFNRYFNKISKVKVVGNIPYYITTPIIERLLKYRNRIDAIFITVQKEFAKRLVACPGSKDYGAFSCFVQYYTEPKLIFPIKKTSFFPSPKVDSCFLGLLIRQKPPFKIKNERLFFKIIRAAFNQRRKTLRNSLKDVISPDKLTKFFNQYSINPDIRPEDLSLADFADLTNI